MPGGRHLLEGESLLQPDSWIISRYKDQILMQRLQGEGVPWGALIKALEEVVPDGMADKNELAYNAVAPTLNEIFGPQDQNWESFKNPETGKMWVRRINS